MRSGAFWDDVGSKKVNGGVPRTNSSKIRAMLQVFEPFSKSCHILPQRNVAFKIRAVRHVINVINFEPNNFSHCYLRVFFPKAKGFM